MSNMQFEKSRDGGWRVLEPVWDWSGSHSGIVIRIAEALNIDQNTVHGEVFYVGRNYVRYFEIQFDSRGKLKIHRDDQGFPRVAVKMRTRRNPFPHYFKDNK